MLLDGIYYGRTPIARAYKNGHIIWIASAEQDTGVCQLGVKSSVVAYVTKNAAKILTAEGNVMLQCYADLQRTPSNAPNLNVLLPLDANVVGRGSTSKASVVDADTAVEWFNRLFASLSSAGLISDQSTVFANATMNDASVRQNYVDESMDVCMESSLNISTSYDGSAATSIVDDENAILSDSNTNNILMNDTSNMASHASAHISGDNNAAISEFISEAGNIDIFQSETNPLCIGGDMLAYNDVYLVMPSEVFASLNDTVNMDIVGAMCSSDLHAMRYVADIVTVVSNTLQHAGTAHMKLDTSAGVEMVACDSNSDAIDILVDDNVHCTTDVGISIDELSDHLVVNTQAILHNNQKLHLAYMHNFADDSHFMATQCSSGCAVTLSLSDGWIYPLPRGLDLFVEQTFLATPNDNNLILE